MKSLIPVHFRNSLERMRDEIDQVFERWLPRRRKDDRDDLFWSMSPFSVGIPAVDMKEDDKEIQITAEMPGLNEDDFTVELTGNRLIISGEKKVEKEDKKKNYYYSECSYGSFSRSLELPCEVKMDEATATYKNGILTIVLPKSEDAVRKRVKIKVK